MFYRNYIQNYTFIFLLQLFYMKLKAGRRKMLRYKKASIVPGFGMDINLNY